MNSLDDDAKKLAIQFTLENKIYNRQTNSKIYI